MNNRIKLTPGQLRDMAGKFRQRAVNIRDLLQYLNIQVDNIESVWSGSAHTSYFAQYIELQEPLYRFPQALDGIASTIENVAQTFEDADHLLAHQISDMGDPVATLAFPGMSTMAVGSGSALGQRSRSSINTGVAPLSSEVHPRLEHEMRSGQPEERSGGRFEHEMRDSPTEEQLEEQRTRREQERIDRRADRDRRIRELPDWLPPFIRDVPIVDNLTETWQEELNDTERALVILFPREALQVERNRQRAYEAEQRLFGDDTEASRWVGQGAAFRHAYWNALNRRDIGNRTRLVTTDDGLRWVNIDVAERFASAHEEHDEEYRAEDVAFGFLGQESINMDLHNNEVGRSLTSHNSGASDSELEALVMEALNNGELSVLSDSTLCTGSLEDGSVCTPCRDGEERHRS